MTVQGIKKRIANAKMIRKVYGRRALVAALIIFVLKRLRVSPQKYLKVLNLLGCQNLISRYIEPTPAPQSPTVSGSDSNTRIMEFFQRQQDDCEKDTIDEKIKGLLQKPLISVLMPVYNSKEVWLEKAIQSLQNQFYENWELCAVDDASPTSSALTVLKSYAETDSRIKYVRHSKNMGIAGASNTALSMATGKYIALLDHDDELTPDALFRIVESMNLHQNAEWFYSDEAIIDDGQNLNFSSAILKPDWSPELLLGTMYTGHLSVYLKTLVEQVGGFRSKYDFSQDYDLALRLKDQAHEIVHVERILYLWRSIPGSAAGGGKDYARISNVLALKDYFEKKKIPVNISISKAGENNVLRFPMKSNPLVSIIIPSDSRDNIIRTVHGIIDTTAYPNYEIVIVCNSKLGKEIQDLYPFLSSLRIVPFDEKFNFSRKCNVGAASCSQSEILAFYNDDVYPLNSDWLNYLVEPLWNIDGVGGISPHLSYENGTIQYAGMFSGFYGMFGTCFHTELLDCDNPQNKITKRFLRNVSILSGACTVIKRSVFVQIGGFNEINTPNGLSDIDLSYKILDAGFRNVYTPLSKLCHIGNHSWASKRNEKDKADIYVMKRWGKYISKDPYYTASQLYFGTEMKPFPQPIKYYIPENLYERYPETHFDTLLVTPEMSNSGAPIVLLNTATLIKKYGGFPVIVTYVDGELTKRALANDIPVIVNLGLREGHPDTTILFQLFAKNFDAIIANTAECYRIPAMMKTYNAKVMTWIHEGASYFENIRIQTGDSGLMQRLDSLSDSTFLCAVNTQMVDFLGRRLKAPVDLLRYALNDINIVRKPRPQNKKFVFLSVASMIEPRKGFDVLIQAFNLLDEKIRNKAELWCIGSEKKKVFEEYMASVKQYAGNASDIQFLGNVSQEEVLNLTAAADVIIAPSREDAGPLTITQGLMLSKACICSSKCGISELIQPGENGFIFENENVVELAWQMQFCINNSQSLKTIGEKGRKIYECFYSPSVFEKNFSEKLRLLIPDLQLPEMQPENEIGGCVGRKHRHEQ